jgi:uncharacterized protein (DUF58 family)
MSAESQTRRTAAGSVPSSNRAASPGMKALPPGSTLRKLLYRSFRTTPELPLRFRRRFTLPGIFVWCLITVTVFLGLDTTQTTAYQIVTLLFAMMMVGLVSALFFKPRIRLRRVLPNLGTVGQTLNYELRLTNEARLAERSLIAIENLEDPRPTLTEFLFTPEPGEEHRNWYDRTLGFYRWRWLYNRKRGAMLKEHPLSVLPGREETVAPMTITPLRRGRLVFTGLTLARPDPFGMVKALFNIPRLDSILVLPERHPIPALDLPGKVKHQQGGVSFASSVGESEEFVALRDYRPGDPLRHIHWRSFARTGRPIVKEFQDEYFVRTALVLDTFGSDLDVFECAVSAAASFACALDTQESLLDLLFVGDEAYCFTAGRGLGQTQQVLEVLAGVQARPEKSFGALDGLMVRHSSQVSGCVCILIDWDDERKAFIRRMQSLQVPVLVILIVPESSKEPPDPGPMKVCPDRFRVIPMNRLKEGLASL